MSEENKVYWIVTTEYWNEFEYGDGPQILFISDEYQKTLKVYVEITTELKGKEGKCHGEEREFFIDQKAYRKAYGDYRSVCLTRVINKPMNHEVFKKEYLE